MKKKISILLIEHDPENARLIREALAKEESVQFEVVVAGKLEEGIQKLSDGQKADVVLINLALPDSQGLDSFLRIRAHTPSIPVVILTNPMQEAVAVEALSRGALDYLLEGVESRLFVRAITFAIERNRAEVELRNLLLIDDLTGLYNRRGFMTFAEQYMKLTQCTNEGLILIFADLENLRQIKEAFGAHEADLAVIRTAKILRDAFRKFDILGHIGPSYFSIVAMETPPDFTGMITNRLHEKFKAYNAQTTNRYKLAMSFGLTYFDPRIDQATTIEDLMARADEALITQRNHKPL
jgi:diguanylate cyclase (GGDEF)-like protein